MKTKADLVRGWVLKAESDLTNARIVAWILFYLLFLPASSFAADDSVCARVKIEIRQELTLERQAFDAHMRINNGLSHITLESVDVDVTFGGEEHVTEVSPDYIFVKPMPQLTLDYFLPTDVYGDDAFTSEIEPPIPFSLGVRVKNNGSGVARNVKIDSAQPKIVENEQGILIGFVIEGSEVNGREATPSLLVDFGEIGPKSSEVACWIMTASLSGRF